MCGIVGTMRFDGGQVDVELLRTMTELLTHRGPDDSGHWVHGSVGFGHRRLSIIDVASSAQPMASPDGQLHLCFNGEILNYRQIREGLSGYPFRTDGDTETLLAAHHRLGAAAVDELKVSSLMRCTTQRQVSCRWCGTGSASCPSTTTSTPPPSRSRRRSRHSCPRCRTAGDRHGEPRRLPLASVGSCSLHALRRRAEAPAGHRLRVSATGSVATERWWSLSDDVRANVDPAQAVDEVAAALETAVGAAMVADVPLGAYLSGGVDSSLIVALMSKLRGGEGVETFAAGFGDARFDELPWARRVSEVLGTRHHEVLVQPDDFATLWPQLTWHRDAPSPSHLT